MKQYLFYAVLAALFMLGEVAMDLVQPGVMSRIVDEGVLGLGNNGVANMNLIWLLGAQMLAMVLFGGFCGSMNNVFVHMSAQNIGNEMRKDAFRNSMRFSFPQRDQFGTGSLVTRMTNDITQVQNFVSTFIRGITRNCTLIIGSIYCMYRLNPRFGIIVLCATPFMLGTLVICLYKGTPLFTVLQDELDEINAIMQEDVSGIRIIKACVREAYEKIRFGKANDELIKTQLKVLVIFAFMNPVVNALMYLVVACILAVGAVDVSAGVTSPGNIMAALTYTTQLLHGIMMMVMIFQNISRGWASWKRVREILRTEPGMKDGMNVPEGAGSRSGEIEFRDVSFTYPDSTQKVLEHINLHIRPGETVAIMGATGCGKSTLVHLIPRFYDVTEGAVLVDGMDVREYPLKELREKVAFTLQKSELFGETISENIAWGRPGADAEEIRAAAVTAQADDFISGTPSGYDTLIAERGASLSGGQKQRVSIARAVLKSAGILIFDDATSALDLKTEANLYQALRESCPEATKIIIAQRIASVRAADCIVVLEHGKIAAQGTHEELLKTSAVYQDIYFSQMESRAM
ncbi:MAG: ABC transporter ATP-binding protein/permease [Lachnospiraceae bacterium]|nr:ABC transporter ATP-binding protein/permease [Lachnospiraceae bacterium]